MKLIDTPKMGKNGMTLIELTVVVLVLLSLISLLFVGARAWKRNADRTANILNLRNIQQGVRACANLKALEIGDTIVATDFIGEGELVETPTLPNSKIIAYIYGSTVPNIGTLYASVSYADATAQADYHPSSEIYIDW